MYSGAIAPKATQPAGAPTLIKVCNDTLTVVLLENIQLRNPAGQHGNMHGAIMKGERLAPVGDE